MFQAKDLVLMAAVTGLTPTSQEVRGSPAVSQDWNWRPAQRPRNSSPPYLLPPVPSPTLSLSLFSLRQRQLSAWNPLCCGVGPGDQRANSTGGWLVYINNQDKWTLKLSLTGEKRRTDLGLPKEDRNREWKAGRERKRWFEGVEGEKWVGQTSTQPEAKKR